jgi:hypothetical protein
MVWFFFFLLGLAIGFFGSKICSRKPKQTKILTADNQGDNRQAIPVEVRITQGDQGLEAGVFNPETDQKIAFSGCVSAVWQEAVAPGADSCLVNCRLEGVPLKWVNHE